MRKDTYIFEVDEYLKSLGQNLPKALLPNLPETSFKKLRPYQNNIKNKLISDSTGISGIELPPGAGKTPTQVKIAEHYLKTGKIIYIGPNSTALDDSIIPLFKAVLGNKQIGTLNDTDVDNDVYFFTPVVFVNFFFKYKALFNKIIKDTSCIILDEVHRMPEDDNTDTLKVYNKVELILRKYKSTKRILTFTATHHRLDGRIPLGLSRKDLTVIITIQELVDWKYCPEIFFLPVVIKSDALNYKWTHTDCILKFNNKDKIEYFNKLAETIHKVYELKNDPFCCFVSRIKDCHELQKRLAKLGVKIGILTCNNSKKERVQVIKDIKDGILKGYVTCGVGTESLDVPAIAVAHLIGKTRSIGKINQCVGRGLRLYEGKASMLVVDYIYSKTAIMDNACGLTEILEFTGSRITKNKVVAGGPVVIRKDREKVDVEINKFVGINVGEIEKGIGCKNSNSIKKLIIAKIHQNKNNNNRFNFLNTQQNKYFSQYINIASSHYDCEFVKLVKNLNPTWLLNYNDFKDDIFIQFILKNDRLPYRTEKQMYSYWHRHNKRLRKNKKISNKPYIKNYMKREVIKIDESNLEKSLNFFVKKYNRLPMSTYKKDNGEYKLYYLLTNRNDLRNKYKNYLSAEKYFELQEAKMVAYYILNINRTPTKDRDGPRVYGRYLTYKKHPEVVKALKKVSGK